MAGDASMAVLAGWLRRRGHEVRGSGMLINVGCAGRELSRLEERLAEFDDPVIVIGQSRGGTLARALAAGHPDQVAGLVTLGSPVLDPLAVSALGDAHRSLRCPARRPRHARGLLERLHGRRLLHGLSTPASGRRSDPGMPALAVHSRSDGIVDWRACLDPYARCVEVDGSHCGMAVNPAVYEELGVGR